MVLVAEKSCAIFASVCRSQLMRVEAAYLTEYLPYEYEQDDEPEGRR